MPVYPTLVLVPGYPVYYAPQLNSNYFFYDGMYWVYQADNWYASSWYNGPWVLVAPVAVPVFVLRVPVRYYRQPPLYFRAWSPNAPPRWGEHWGNAWEQRRRGWDNWNLLPCRRRHRCLSISANMRAIDIRASSSSTRFKASITPTNRATPSCSSTTRRSEHRVRPRDLRRQTKECLTRQPPRRRKADRLQHSNALQADPRRKREVATPRGPPPHQRLPSLGRPQRSLRASSRIRRGPRARIRRRGQKVRTKGRKTRGQRRTQSKVQEKGEVKRALHSSRSSIMLRRLASVLKMSEELCVEH